MVFNTTQYNTKVVVFKQYSAKMNLKLWFFEQDLQDTRKRFPSVRTVLMKLFPP